MASPLSTSETVQKSNDFQAAHEASLSLPRREERRPQFHWGAPADGTEPQASPFDISEFRKPNILEPNPLCGDALG